MEISKFKSQLFVAFEQGTAPRRRVQTGLVKLRRIILGTLQSLQSALRYVENGLWNAAGNSRGAIVATEREIRRFGSQLSNGFGQRTIRLGRARITLASLARTGAYGSQRLREALRLSENLLRKALGDSRGAIVAMSHGSRKFKRRLSNVSEHGMEHLRRAENMFSRMRKSTAEKLQNLPEVFRPVGNGLLKAARNSHSGIVLVNRSIGKSRAKLSGAFEQEVASLRRAQSTLRGLVNRVIEKPRTVRQELHEKENELRDLLASSLDAIVVTNDKRRFVAANRKALELFGVSEKNLGSFTIDVFFLNGPKLGFGGRALPFAGRQERHSRCKIRRLDGSLRFAECAFVANFVPFRHLCRFYEVTPQNRQATFVGRFKPGHGNM